DGDIHPAGGNVQVAGDRVLVVQGDNATVFRVEVDRALRCRDAERAGNLGAALVDVQVERKLSDDADLGGLLFADGAFAVVGVEALAVGLAELVEVELEGRLPAVAGSDGFFGQGGDVLGDADACGLFRTPARELTGDRVVFQDVSEQFLQA